MSYYPHSGHTSRYSYMIVITSTSKCQRGIWKGLHACSWNTLSIVFLRFTYKKHILRMSRPASKISNKPPTSVSTAHIWYLHVYRTPLRCSLSRNKNCEWYCSYMYSFHFTKPLCTEMHWLHPKCAGALESINRHCHSHLFRETAEWISWQPNLGTRTLRGSSSR